MILAGCVPCMSEMGKGPGEEIKRTKTTWKMIEQH
jgi:hypothetical protein